MIPEVFHCEQGTPEWYAARLGIPTASCFATVMAKGKEGGVSLTRKKYMNQLAGEILTGRPMDNYENNDMVRGSQQEDDARNLYAFLHDEIITQVGFVRNGQKGASPDSLVGSGGGLEIKSALPHIQIERILRGSCPPEHVAQVQGNIWVCEREWWDFCSYCPDLPLFRVRVMRDDAYIQKLSSAVDIFNEDLAAVVETVRRYGGTELSEAA